MKLLTKYLAEGNLGMKENFVTQNPINSIVFILAIISGSCEAQM